MPASGIVHEYCYWIVFHEALVHPARDDGPIVDLATIASRDDLATRPHCLDRNMVPTLPVLWHVLHLPRSGFDYLETSATELIAATDRDISSTIVVAPPRVALSSTSASLRTSRAPDLVFFGQGVDRTELEAAFPDALGFVRFEDVGTQVLKAHWNLLAVRVPEFARQNVQPPTESHDVGTAPTMLPVQFFARQMHTEHIVDNSSDFRITAAWTMQAHAYTLARMESAGIPEADVGIHFDRIFKAHGREHMVNVVVGAPGVSPFYRRHLSGGVPARDLPIENSAINYMIAHRALAMSGIGVALPEISDECFHHLAALEDYFAYPRLEGPGVTRRRYVRPRVVRRYLRRIAEELAPLFANEDLLRVLHQCKSVSAFSNFPIGLARIPGASAPLSCMFPISYRPLTPLSRTLVQEGLPQPLGSLSLPIKILLVECVSPDDKIYALGRQTWPVLARQAERAGFAKFVIADADSCEAVQQLVARERPAILIISAHGFYDRRRNVSGVVIGGKRVVGPELGVMPPLVVLSACHVSPRGVGTMSIVDMLLRSGATAVLGTLVPVDARWNATLLGRFFTNLRAGATGEVDLRSIQDVWQHVLSTNAVHDVLNTSRRVRNWGLHGTINGHSILEEFQNHRSRGRLRAAYIYEDTERILQEIADETGFGDSFRAALSSESYVPESLFYYLAGWPERIGVPHL